MTEASFQVKTAGEVAKNTPSAKVLVPNGNDAYERLRSRSVGEVFRVVMKLHRNYKFLSKAHKLIKFAFDCQEAYTDLQEFREAVTIEAGFSRIVKNMKGEEILVAKSWAFDNMTESEFQELFDAMISAMLRHTETIFCRADPAMFSKQLVHFSESGVE